MPSIAISRAGPIPSVGETPASAPLEARIARAAALERVPRGGPNEPRRVDGQALRDLGLSDRDAGQVTYLACG